MTHAGHVPLWAGRRAGSRTARLGLLACALWAVAAGAETVTRVETWDSPGTAGWGHQAHDSLVTNVDGRLSIAFPLQGKPQFSADVASGVVEPGMLITNISLRFRAFERPPSALRLYVRSTNGQVWQRSLPPPATGEWTAYSVPLRYASGWFVGSYGTRKRFLHDRAHIAEIGVYVRRSASPQSQDYGIDDVCLAGLATTEADIDGDGMSNMWENDNALDPEDYADGAEDADGDGALNYAESVAGTDPRDSASLLLLDLDVLPVAGIDRTVRLRWLSTANRTYSVWRAEALTEPGFAPLATNIAPNPPTNTYDDATATNAGSFFYRITVDP